jgi:DNA-binding CsgD family transcriptional regulator
MRYFIGAVLVDDDDQLIWTSVQRGPDQPRVGIEQQRAYQAALPYLSNALALYSRMRALPAATALADTLDRIAEPIAIVGDDRTVLFANRIMRAIFDERAILGAERGRLVAFGTPLRAGLVRLVATIRAGQPSARETVARPGGLRPLTLRAVVLTREHGRQFQAGDDPLICLMIDDPERPFIMGLDQAARTFGLTTREAMVGSYLVAGRSGREIAARLNLSHNTVRSHVARLREKVGERSALGVAARLRAESTIFR